MSGDQQSAAASSRLPAAVQPWLNPRRKRCWALIAILVYTLGGFFLVPWLAKRELLALVETETGLQASLGELHVNPYVLSVEALDFQLREADGTRFAAFDRLFLNLQLRSLLRRALVLREATLEAPFVNIVRFEDGGLNLLQLGGARDAPPDDAGGGELPRLVIDDLRLVAGTADISDQVPGTDFFTTIGPVSIELFNLSTLPAETGRQRIEITTPAGVHLQIAGDLSLQPLASSGRISGGGPYLPLLYRYIQDEVNFSVEQGNVEVGFDYQLAWREDGVLDLTVTGLDMDVTGIEMRAATGPENFLSMPRQSLRGGYFDLAGRSAGADALTIGEPVLRIARYVDGSLSLAKLLPAPAPDAAGPEGVNTTPADATGTEEAAADPVDAAAPEQAVTGSADAVAPEEAVRPVDDPAPGEAGSTPTDDAETLMVESAADDWEFRLARFEIDQLTIDVKDQALRGDPVSLVATPVRLELGDLSNQPGSPVSVKASAVLESGGRIDAEGAVQLLPEIDLRLQLSAEKIGLPVINAYLAEIARVRLGQGELTAGVELRLSPEEPFAVDGTAAVDGLEIADSDKDQRLLGWRRLNVDRFEFSTAANRLDISELSLAAPYARLLIDADGSTNFQQLMVTAEPTAAQPAAAEDSGQDTGERAEPAAALAVTLGRIRIDEGAADFTDRNLPLPFEAKIAGLGGEISTLSTGSSEPASVRLEGKVDDYGLARVEGKLNPLDPIAATDIRLQFRNVEFPDLSPYTVKFAGREIEDGRLDVDLRYVIDKGQMRGENSVIIDRLALGEKVDYPDAANLPLGLAIALLKKPDGTIDIDLPVSGDVNDPSFSVGGVVFRAFVNLITKMVTSPFRLLGSLVGVDSEDFDLIEFTPGRADVAPPEQEKLVRLAEALAQRPQLGLKIAGVSDAEADGLALRTARVEAALEASLAAEEGRRASEMLAVRQRRALEALLEEREPDIDLKAVQASFQQPEDPADPEGRQVLDELAYSAGLRQRLIDSETVSDTELGELATARAEAIRGVVLQTGSVSEDRLSIEDPATASMNDDGWIPLKLEASAVDAGS